MSDDNKQNNIKREEIQIKSVAKILFQSINKTAERLNLHLKPMGDLANSLKNISLVGAFIAGVVTFVMTMFVGSATKPRYGRVDDWRGGCRSRGVAVSGGFRLMPVPHCRRTVTPFPVAARQTGHADFPHPAFSRPVRPSLSAGRRAAAGRYRGRVSHRDTRPGSGGTRRLVVPFAASTSGELAAQCMRG